MDDFVNRIEELNSKLTIKKNCPSQQNVALQAVACSGSAPTSYFITSLCNDSLTGSIMPNCSSPSQLAKESPLRDEVSFQILVSHLTFSAVLSWEGKVRWFPLCVILICPISLNY